MKAAIVGCGGIGKAHARAYSRLEGVSLAACVDRDAQRADALSAEFGAVALDSICRLPDDVRLVSVTTDPASHHPVAMELLGQGRHVFCEKPLGMTGQQARELSQLAADSGLALSVGFKMRYEPCFMRARRLMPRIGRVVAVSTTKTQPFQPRPSDWRPQVGAMFELSVHEFDLIGFITGLEPVRVHSAKLSRRFGWSTEDGFAAVVEYEGGVVTSLSANYTTNSSWQGRDLCMTITGERGYLRILRGDQIICHAEEYQSEAADAPGDTFVRELEGFIGAIAGGCDPPIPAAAGVQATRLVDAIRRSASAAGPVELSDV